MSTLELFEYDKTFGASKIAGVDEAGRGPLAGPVICACCMLPNNTMIDGINDSKKLSESMREKLYAQIINEAIAYGIGIVNEDIIDQINILNATKLGMKRAIEQMRVRPDLVLIDAVTKLDITVPFKSIIKGDAKSYQIAAASVLAKVTRDRLMRDYDEKYPDYGFCKNKGYGTRVHIEALEKIGACPIHRRSFLSHFSVPERLLTNVLQNGALIESETIKISAAKEAK